MSPWLVSWSVIIVARAGGTDHSSLTIIFVMNIHILQFFVLSHVFNYLERQYYIRIQYINVCLTSTRITFVSYRNYHLNMHIQSNWFYQIHSFLNKANSSSKTVYLIHRIIIDKRTSHYIIYCIQVASTTHSAPINRMSCDSRCVYTLDSHAITNIIIFTCILIFKINYNNCQITLHHPRLVGYESYFKCFWWIINVLLEYFLKLWYSLRQNKQKKKGINHVSYFRNYDTSWMQIFGIYPSSVTEK